MDTTRDERAGTAPPPAGEDPGARVLLARPRGFCAGVDRAIEIVERALELYGPPVYVLHEIVHNRHVLDDFRARGVRFVEDMDDVPAGSVMIFSAHGVSDEVVRRGREGGLRVIDATCPLVTKVHAQAQRYEADRRELILIGHLGHPEIEGTRGRVSSKVHIVSTPDEVAALEVDDPERLAYVTQTTLSVDDTRDVIDALRERFPSIQGPNLEDICYATQNRQNAVKAMSDEIDLLVVVGSRNSSNSNRLCELGRRKGIDSYLIDSASDLDPAWVANARSIGVTAGASAPESVVQGVIGRLAELGVSRVTELEGEPESIVFGLPPQLKGSRPAAGSR